MKKIPISVKRPVFYTFMLFVIILLGWTGFNEHYNLEGVERGVSSILYDIFRLFFLEHDFEQDPIPLALNIARFLAPLLLATALLDVFYSFLKSKLDSIIIRWFYKDHVVFCGLGSKNYRRAKIFSDNKEKVVIIESKKDNSHLNDFTKKKNVKIIIGKANSDKNLQKANIVKAGKAFIACGNDLENLKIAKNIQGIFDSRKDQINAIRRKNQDRSMHLTINITEFENEYLFKKLEDKKGDLLDISSFNAYTRFAALLVDLYSPDKYQLSFGRGDCPTHVLIWGDSKLALSVLIEAAHLYHFPELKKLRITLICSNQDQMSDQIKIRYPDIERLIDLTVLNKTALFNGGIEKLARDISVGFVCEESSAAGFIVAKRLRQLFFNAYLETDHLSKKLRETEKNQLLGHPPIVIADSNPEDFSEIFHNQEDYLKRLKIAKHNMFKEVFSKNMMVNGTELTDCIAKQIHNLYLGLNAAELNKAWELLTDAGKDQNRWAARHLFIKLRFLGLELKEGKPGEEHFEFNEVTYDQRKTMAIMEHRRWVAEKYLTGFTKGQPMGDKAFYKELKQYLNWHQDIVDWDQLDRSRQDIDKALSDIGIIAGRLGMKLERIT